MRRVAVAVAIAVLTVACGGSPPNQPSTGGTFADATCADLAAWAKGLGPVPKRAFVVHGESGLTAMAEILKQQGVPDVTIPALHQSFDLA